MDSLEEKEEELKILERAKMKRMLDAMTKGELPIRGCQPSCLPPLPPPLPPQIQNTMSPLQQSRLLFLPPRELHPCSTNAMVQPVPPPPQAANNMQILPTNLEPAVSNTVSNPVTPASFCQRMSCFRNIVHPYPFGGKFTKNKRRRLHSSHKKVRAKKSKNNKHKRSSKRHKRYTRKH